MKLGAIPFATIDWSALPTIQAPGLSGFSLSKVVDHADVRIRRVEFSAGYDSDHWCSKGHFVHVLAGRLVTDLADGRSISTSAGQSWIVGDDVLPHRASAPEGATVLIIDERLSLHP